MSKKLYLLSVGLLLLAALLSIVQGTRFIRSPLGFFQIVSLVNMFMPLVLGLLLAFFLGARFLDVWRGDADVEARASRPLARACQTAGKFLIVLFYIFLMAAIGFLVLGKGQLSGEVGFLFGPLFRTLPVGLVLFELGRLLDRPEQA